MNSRVLVTGAASPLGAALGRRLEQREDVEAIFGLDLVDPRAGFERLEFVHTDTRHSVLVKLIRELEIDTVIHCATRCEGREPPRLSHETNVIGTMNVLAACSGAASPVRRLVVKSSVAVYGARLGLPGLIGERVAGRRPPGTVLERELLEMEQLVSEHAARQRDQAVVTVRLGFRLNRTEATAFARALSAPVLLSAAGFDPRLQFLADNDAAEGLERAALGEAGGVFNLSGNGVVLLSQVTKALRLLWLPVLPPGSGERVAWVVRRLGLPVAAHLPGLLTYGSVVDSRAFVSTFGWRPRQTSREVVRQFAAELAGEAGTVPVLEPELERFLRQRRRPASSHTAG
ncbi:MAG: NAD-dependent epimerase/dehydratase family protein [Candidatus Dormibacteraeota bacterium]|nr:NAD-dependent epimerase/dehydratase family protein [Candidatus Dormibacteraeota bacterium]